MKRLVRPWMCTSLSCGEPPQPHCRDCSHAIYRGKATLNRTTYRWQHSPQFGPLFSRRKDGECDWIPHRRHPVWICFKRWHDAKFGKANRGTSLKSHPPATGELPGNGAVECRNATPSTDGGTSHE